MVIVTIAHPHGDTRPETRANRSLMGIILSDLGRRDAAGFHVNFWHWRALVEAIRRLDVLPGTRVDGLHEPFCGNGLTQEESRFAADKLEACLLPTLAEDDRLLLDGRLTRDPDDGTFYKGEDAHKNYSTNRAVLLAFIRFLRGCGGFEVL
ncbi:hypothetical protein WMF18_39615 [Sorangium sp. So ce315]|uniref:hypothetical protein n=1 Tax=Sorangium sp. So ce315 TaxID=3133299 RepID=UPI003F62B05E